METITLFPPQTQQDWSFVEMVYLNRFPAEERKDFSIIMQDHRENTLFSVQCIQQGNERIGFITIWTLDKFLFIEHFAIDEHFSNKGIGGNVLQEIIVHSPFPMVLETEPQGVSPLAQRRIDFYLRNGFTLLENDYFQPPYSPDLPLLPLKIMIHLNGNTALPFEQIKNEIYSKVYQCNPTD